MTCRRRWNRRFDAVDLAILEQRQYTEFAYTSLDAKMDAGFARLEAKMDNGSARLDAKMDNGFSRMDARFERLERKLDQFIDLHL